MTSAWVAKVKVKVLVAQLCQLCDPMDCSPPSSPVHGISQARILEGGATSYSRGPPDPGTEPTSLASLALAGGFFIISTTWKAPLINELILFLAALGFSYNLQDLSLWCTDSSQQQTHFPLVEVLQACGTQA